MLCSIPREVLKILPMTMVVFQNLVMTMRDLLDNKYLQEDRFNMPQVKFKSRLRFNSKINKRVIIKASTQHSKINSISQRIKLIALISQKSQQCFQIISRICSNPCRQPSFPPLLNHISFNSQITLLLIFRKICQLYLQVVATFPHRVTNCLAKRQICLCDVNYNLST